MPGRISKLLKLWFTFEEPVSRKTYLRHGLALAAVKYAVDASLIYAATSTIWTPLDYLRFTSLLPTMRLRDVADSLAPILALWTLPFLWIGITMTIRRLLDIGWSAWWALLFFVPFLGYALMATLAVVPGRPQPITSATVPPPDRRLPKALLSMAVGVALGLALMWLGIQFFSYGTAIFLGAPFCIGLATAFTFCRNYPATTKETFEVVLMTIFILTGVAIAVGTEGIMCLVMIAPLAIVLGWMGGVTGRFLAGTRESPVRGALMLMLVFPGAVTIEGGSNPANLREVKSAVVINAPATAVWHQVIAFSPIPEPTSLLFRLGLAYPIRAEIHGSGVGAIRYCVFSTGAFVEPITAWEPGRRLAFDVIENPRPLNELTFRRIAPPHLEGYLVSRRGEFRLVQLSDGRTRLEGSTWYEQRLRPEGYWVVFSDYIIGKIHRRVLDHIKREAETG